MDLSWPAKQHQASGCPSGDAEDLIFLKCQKAKI
jgi:hypothetical protein